MICEAPVSETWILPKDHWPTQWPVYTITSTDKRHDNSRVNWFAQNDSSLPEWAKHLTSVRDLKRENAKQKRIKIAMHSRFRLFTGNARRKLISESKFSHVTNFTSRCVFRTDTSSIMADI
jgi:hypothetical protein